MRIDTSGNLGLGTSTAANRLTVSATGLNITGGNAIDGTNMQGIRLQNTLNDNSSLGLWFGTNNVHWAGISGQRTNFAGDWTTDLRFYTHEAALVDVTYARERMRIDGAGNVGIGTTSPSAKLHVIGDILASGNVTAYSDIRVKDNIATVENALDLVSSMRGVTYTLKENGEAGVGVVAQEMCEVLPQVVNQNGEYMSVAYGNLVGVLIEAIKELTARVAQLEGK